MAVSKNSGFALIAEREHTISDTGILALRALFSKDICYTIPPFPVRHQCIFEVQRESLREDLRNAASDSFP